MYKTFNVTNVNELLPKVIRFLADEGRREDTRNSGALVAPGPVCVHYSQPRQRVLFDPVRNANPFFHFFESMWMLAGQDCVSFPARFAKNILSYSDDGETLRGAYGERWFQASYAYPDRHEQLLVLIDLLRQNPESRRGVLSMWNYERGDLRESWKDTPCNTHAYFDLRRGALNMHVMARSNDAWWGAYGANVVQFSFLQEFVAGALEVEVGSMYQTSHNLHLYDVIPETLGCKTDDYDSAVGYLSAQLVRTRNYYAGVNKVVVRPSMPVLQGGQAGVFLREARFLVEDPDGFFGDEGVIVTPFLRAVARPMFRAWALYEKGELQRAKNVLSEEMHVFSDWGLAAREWLDRIQAKRVKAGREADKEPGE